MELYNSIIEKIDGLLGSTQPKRYEYNPDRCWEDVGGNQLVMMKEAAYELGGDVIKVNSKGESYISYADLAIAIIDEVKNGAFINKRFTAVGER